MKFFVSSVLFLLFPFCVLAQTLELEESPDQDLGQTERTAEELSINDHPQSGWYGESPWKGLLLNSY